MAQIPDDASVSATTYIIPHLSGRREITRLPALEIKNDEREITSVDYIIADLWQMEQYQAAFSEDREALGGATNLINTVVAQNRYGLIDFANGVVLLQQGVNSNQKAIADWQDYQEKIKPIIESN